MDSTRPCLYVNFDSAIPAGWNVTTVADIKAETSEVRGVTKQRKAPIPAGCVASGITGENTIAGGFVIYETGNTDTTTNGFWTATDANDGELVCQKTYNQYVWIPVDNVNDMIMCESRTASSECNIEFVNGVLQCTNSNHSSTATDLCGRLYGGFTNNADGAVFGTQHPETYSYCSGYREPAVVTYKFNPTSLSDYLNNEGYGHFDAYTSNRIKNENGTQISGASNILTEFKRQFNNMAKSVATYGGFYVGRYEAGEIGTSLVSIKALPASNIINDRTFYASSNEGGRGSWYGVYNNIITAKTGMVGQMIWGCQWDQMMKFIDGKDDGNGDTFDVKVEKEARHTGSKAPTGANINDLVQNIYDLEGNCSEYNATAKNDDCRVLRSHSYSYSSSYNYWAASSIGSERPNPEHMQSGNISSRQSLYVIP